MLQAVIFDIDGTLVDSVDFHAAAWQTAFRKFGKNVPYTDVRKQVGKGSDQLLPMFLSPAEVSEYGKQLEEYRGGLFKDQYLPQVRPFSGVRELFRRLRDDGKKVTLASSAKKDDLKEYLRIAEIEDLVEMGTSSEDVSKSKPHPDVFESAMGQLGAETPRPETVVIGDSPWDAEGAVRAGLKPIGVLCGGFPAYVLSNAGCTRLYRNPADLLIHYERWIGKDG